MIIISRTFYKHL